MAFTSFVQNYFSIRNIIACWKATGNYSALLVYLLSEAGITISLENPLKIKNFARVMLTVTKTDEIDARLIALLRREDATLRPYKTSQ